MIQVAPQGGNGKVKRPPPFPWQRLGQGCIVGNDDVAVSVSETQNRFEGMLSSFVCQRWTRIVEQEGRIATSTHRLPSSPSPATPALICCKGISAISLTHRS